MEKQRRALLFLSVLIFFSCASAPPLMERYDSPQKSLPPPEIQTLPRADYLTIVAAGDNLYHAVMIGEGENGNYETAYTEIQDLIGKADIAFINQETLLAGKDFGFSGYPQFNSPQELGRAITAAGFNVVNHATNHTMDKGEKAVLATLDFWDTIPQVTILGIHRSEEQRTLPRLLKKNNITIGFLSYTYGTNGIPVPPSKPFMVSLANTEIMAKDIDALRPLCDFLMVSMHWGEEYKHEYNKKQEELAAFLAEHSVDLVIGHHPHVIQPIEYIPRPDGRFMLCFYSLGNLISAQSHTPTLLGALACIRIEKTSALSGNAAGIIHAGAIPLVTHYEKNYTGFKVYPLYTYTEELVEKHWKNQAKKELTINYLYALAAKVFGDKEIRQDPFDSW